MPHYRRIVILFFALYKYSYLLTYLLTYLLAVISNMPTIRCYMYKVAKTDMRTEE